MATYPFLTTVRLTVYPIAANALTMSATIDGQYPVVGITPLAIARPTTVAAAVIQNSVVWYPGFTAGSVAAGAVAAAAGIVV
jgi:predicted anti-sigma-YlaC factor YlaD